MPIADGGEADLDGPGGPLPGGAAEVDEIHEELLLPWEIGPEAGPTRRYGPTSRRAQKSSLSLAEFGPTVSTHVVGRSAGHEHLELHACSSCTVASSASRLSTSAHERSISSHACTAC